MIPIGDFRYQRGISALFMSTPVKKLVNVAATTDNTADCVMRLALRGTFFFDGFFAQPRGAKNSFGICA